MRSFWPVLLRIVLVIAVCLVVQYWIPWYLLAAGGLIAGFFVLKTSDDRPTALGLLIGSALFAIYAFVIAQYFPVQG
jgi:hypothetical protein